MPRKRTAAQTILPTDAPALDLEQARPAFEAALRLAQAVGGFAGAELAFPNGADAWSLQVGAVGAERCVEVAVRSADGARLGTLRVFGSKAEADGPRIAPLLADIAALAAQAHDAVLARETVATFQAATPTLLKTLVTAAPLAVAIYDR